MAEFSVVVVTAAPPGQAAESGGSMLKIDGREALLKSVEMFINREHIAQIQIVFAADALNEAKSRFGAHFGFSGVKLLSGGDRWIEQLAAAAPTIDGNATHVLVHDAARPAVPYTDLEAIMAAAEKHPVVGLATPLRSMLVETDEGGNALAYHPPGRFMHLVTPQAFRKDEFLEMARTKTEIHPSKITLMKGSPLNVRIGGPGDASLIKAMLNMLPRPKVRASSNPFEEAQW